MDQFKVTFVVSAAKLAELIRVAGSADKVELVANGKSAPTDGVIVLGPSVPRAGTLAALLCEQLQKMEGTKPGTVTKKQLQEWANKSKLVNDGSKPTVIGNSVKRGYLEIRVAPDTSAG